MEWASRHSVEEAMHQWNDEQVACRTYGHRWQGHTVTHTPGVYTVTQRCSRCKNRRWQEMDERGYPLTRWHAIYQNGYLLKDVGRVGVEGRAALRLATVLKMKVVEVDDA